METEEMERRPFKVKVEVIREDPNKVAPIVAYFQSGYNPKSEDPPPSIRVLRSTLMKGRLRLDVIPKNPNLHFTGTSYTGEAALPQTCTFALGVLNKGSGTLKVVPIAANKIFRLDPVFSLEDRPTVLDEEEVTPQVKAGRVQELISLYGTKKSIKAAKKIMSLNQEEDPMMERKFNEADVVDKAALEAISTLTTSTTSSRNTPPYNAAATNPADAYPLDKIIMKWEWDSLNAGLDDHVRSSFITNRLGRLCAIQNEVEKRKMTSLLSYVNHLIEFKDHCAKRKRSDSEGRSNHCKIPMILGDRFASSFLDRETGMLSDEKRDLIVSYVLVLTLFVDDFRTDPTDIARDLKMTTMNMRPHFENLGCKFVRDHNILYASLSVPLQFPKWRRAPRHS